MLLHIGGFQTPVDNISIQDSIIKGPYLAICSLETSQA